MKIYLDDDQQGFINIDVNDTTNLDYVLAKVIKACLEQFVTDHISAGAPNGNSVDLEDIENILIDLNKYVNIFEAKAVHNRFELSNSIFNQMKHVFPNLWI